MLSQIDWIRKKSEVVEDTSNVTANEADGSPGGFDESDDQELAFITSTTTDTDEPVDKASKGEQHLQQLTVIRRLFKKAIEINKYHSASWIGWAKFEQKYGNVGKILLSALSIFIFHTL